MSDGQSVDDTDFEIIEGVCEDCGLHKRLIWADDEAVCRNCRFKRKADKTEVYEFEITVRGTEQGGMEASDRLAGACSKIQEHPGVMHVKSKSDAPNDFRTVDPDTDQ